MPLMGGRKQWGGWPARQCSVLSAYTNSPVRNHDIKHEMIGSDDENEEARERASWTTITSRKKGKGGKERGRRLSHDSQADTSSFRHQTRYLSDRALSSPEDIAEEGSRLLVAVEAAKSCLASTTFFLNLENALLTRSTKKVADNGEGNNTREIRSLVCYGLGSIQSTNSHALWQLACVCLIKDRLNVHLSPPRPSTPLPSHPSSTSSSVSPLSPSSTSQVQSLTLPLVEAEMFDPVFDDVDSYLLNRLGWRVIPHNEECKRPARVPTLFFMPCCHRRLYSNLLWANWSPESLKNVVVVGNSLKSYQERAWALEEDLDPTDCVLPLLPWVREMPLSWRTRTGSGGTTGCWPGMGREEEKGGPKGEARGMDDRVVKTAFVDMRVVDFVNLPPPVGEAGGSEEKDVAKRSLWHRRPPENRAETASSKGGV